MVITEFDLVIQQDFDDIICYNVYDHITGERKYFEVYHKTWWDKNL